MSEKRIQRETQPAFADPSERVYPIQFVQIGNLSDVPVPLARVTTCGGFHLEVLHEVIKSNPPQGRYRGVSLLNRPKGCGTALTLLKILVSQPGYSISRDWLSEHLSANRNPKEDDDEEWERGMARVDNVVVMLRGLLCPLWIAEQDKRALRKFLVKTLRNHRESGLGYQVATEPLVWLDVDEIASSIKLACVREERGKDALPFWEQAYTLVAKGAFLPNEPYSDWATNKRAEIDGYLRQAVHALRHLLILRHGEASENRVIFLLRQYWQTHPTDEEALRQLMELLSNHGSMQEAQECYQRLCEVLQKEGDKPDRRTQETAQNLVRFGQNISASAIQTLPSHSNSASLFSRQIEEASPFSRIVSRGIMLSQQDSGEQALNHSRRQIISGMLTTAYTVLTLSPYMLLQPEKQEPFLAAMHETSPLNKAIVDDLEEITRKYWKLSVNLSFSLLSGIQGHFQNIMHLLNTPQEPSLHRELLSLASEAAQLLGKTLFDLRDYSLALSYYTFAIKAALEAHHYDLWAVALGRISLLFLSTAQPQQALSCLREIQSASIQSQKIRSWCAVIEAEAHSYLCNSSLCLNALKRAKDTTEDIFLETDLYATGFTKSRMASYEGSCYLRLNQPESALPALQRAMTLLDPAAIRNRSRLLTYIGEAHILLGDAQQAYFSAHQALDLTQQTQSLDILYQVQALNNKLLMKAISPDSRDLNQRIQEMCLIIANTRGLYE